VYRRLQGLTALTSASAYILQTSDFWSGGGGIRTLDTPLRGITP
jgi:hypothetical protein